MASNDVTEKILDLSKQSPDALDAPQRVLRTFSSATITKPDPGELFLTNEDKYLALMMGSMEYAIFPHAMRPAFVLCGHNYAGVGMELRGATSSYECSGRKLGACLQFEQIGSCLFKYVFRDGSMQIPNRPHKGQGGSLV